VLSFKEAKQWVLDNPGKYIKYSPECLSTRGFTKNFWWFSKDGEIYFSLEGKQREYYNSDVFLSDNLTDTFVIVE
jgi:hypothetical protein